MKRPRKEETKARVSSLGDVAVPRALRSYSMISPPYRVSTCLCTAIYLATVCLISRLISTAECSCSLLHRAVLMHEFLFIQSITSAIDVSA